MEAIIRSLFNLGTEELDRLWTGITDAFFCAFLVILVGTPILAHWGGSAIILFNMLAFFVLWIVMTLRLRNIVFVSGGAFIVGIPVEGDAAKIAQIGLEKFLKSVFLVLIWAEIYMAVYFHLPSLAKEWWMIGSAIAIMLVMIPLVIYAVSTGMMMVGPWHRPIFKGCVFFIALIVLSAIPSTFWTGLGINPIALMPTRTASEAQETRERSFKNLDEKNSDLIKKKYRAKVDNGGVLTDEENAELNAIDEKVANSVPNIPSNRITATIQNAGGEYAVYGVAGVGVALLLFFLTRTFSRKNSGDGATTVQTGSTSVTKTKTSTSSSRSWGIPWFWIIIIGALVGGYMYVDGVRNFVDDFLIATRVISPHAHESAPLLPRVHE